jgi:hypothetical protein
VIIKGHAFMQNVRRGHYELAVEASIGVRLAVAFGELAAAIRSEAPGESSACHRPRRRNSAGVLASKWRAPRVLIARCNSARHAAGVAGRRRRPG